MDIGKEKIATAHIQMAPVQGLKKCKLEFH